MTTYREVEERQVVFVDYEKPIPFKIEQFLVKRRFFPADSRGDAKSPSADATAIGILSRNTGRKVGRIRGFFSALASCFRLRYFLGVISFASSEEWVIDVYGREHVETVRQLAEEMILMFSVKVTIHLKSEDLRHEYVEPPKPPCDCGLC